MKKILLTLSLAFFLLPSIGSAQIADKLADTLQGLLNQRGKLYQLKSAAAAIQFPDGSVWNGAYGNCGGIETSPDFLFEMGSNTKTFTATMILQLADEGKLKLTDTIYKYLPVHPNIAYGITIRQLLNHTSGIFNYTEAGGFSNYINGDPGQHVSMDSVIKNWIGPMLFTPGSQWSYSNTNYILLGKIIEKLDGVPYKQALRTGILDKFGFKETYLDAYEPYTMPKAGNWLNDGSYMEEDFTSFMSAAWAAGAIVATPRDLAKWARALYSGKILPDHWLDSMKVGIPAGGGYTYGLGAFMHTTNSKKYIGHGGTTLQNSEMDYSISSDFSVVTVLNQQDKGTQAGNIQRALIAIVEKSLPALGINEAPAVSFRYYPNPVSDHFTLALDADFLQKHPSSTLNIYSLSGTLVRTVMVTQPNPVIYRDNLSSGLYLMEITDAKTGIVFRNKLVLK